VAQSGFSIDKVGGHLTNRGMHRRFAVPFTSPNRATAFLRQTASAALLCLLLPGTIVAEELAAVFHADKLTQIDSAISLAISDRRLPGGVVWIERGDAAYHKAFGHRAVEPTAEPTTADTIFDAASLTKVIATTTAIMKLIEVGKLTFDTPVSEVIPEFTGAGKEAITIRQLLTHTSGLRPGIPLARWTGADGAVTQASQEPLPAAPGTAFRYSDINFILLGAVVHRVSGKTLDAFCAEEIFGPLGMHDTSFNPPETLRPRIAPTEREGAGLLRGVVHDPTARRMGGVAGHAGLFSTASDLARFARMLLGRGELEGTRILKAETVALMTSVQTPEAVSARRGFGWDIDSPYAGPRGAWFPIGSYGHTGWTGGSFWIDPFSRTFVIFLSNRNHPTEAGNVVQLRRSISTLTAEAIRGFNFLHVPGSLGPKPGAAAGVGGRTLRAPATVLTGLDVLARDGFAPLRGLRIGLVTNHTGLDRQRRPAIDLLQKAPEVQLVALFGPEHGIRGAVDEKFGDSRDAATGLPVYSLYGETRAPSAAQLAELDALVFDIQDIGCRFYTYISTLGECLNAAKASGKKVFVLDRPNPVTGSRVEGPMVASERSFVGWHDIPTRHGMTAGELAQMFAAERAPGVDLTVIPCEGWARDVWFDETSLPWTDPSPNMRSLTAAVLYPGVGLLEFCNLSVGRGTDRPFEYVGAPYIDDRALAAALQAAELPGLRFVPVRFTPKASVFANKECGGVQILVTNRDAVSPLDLGMVLATALHRLHPADLKVERMQKLLLHPPTLEAIRAAKPLDEIKALWAAEREAFRARREQFLLYK
jgi:uncharacterized protein YbbC (DUF1343 family)/CubicO group peptidase (beta-lactamase class C family)